MGSISNIVKMKWSACHERGTKKNLSPRQDSNLSPPRHRGGEGSGALSTWAMESSRDFFFVPRSWHADHFIFTFVSPSLKFTIFHSFTISNIVYYVINYHCAKCGAFTINSKSISPNSAGLKRTHLGSALLEYSANRKADLSKFWSLIPILQPAILHNVVNLRGAVLRVFHTLSVTEKVEEIFHRYSGIRCPAKRKDLPQ